MSLLSQYGDMNVFLEGDGSQQEIRVLAQYSKDPLLLKYLKAGEDIHSAVGHELTGKPIEVIKKDRETRTKIKGLHFGIIFGLKALALYYKLKTEAEKAGEAFSSSQKDIEELYENYFLRFKGVKVYINKQIELAQDRGWVETMFGFPREISQSGDEERDTFWMNQAVNTPIQGTAHQLVLIALAILDKKKKTYALLQRLSMEIHDALVAFSKLKDLPQAFERMTHLVEVDVIEYVNRVWPELDWQVPLVAEVKAGLRFGVLIPYKGGKASEFIEEWCEKNFELEKRLKQQIREGTQA